MISKGIYKRVCKGTKGRDEKGLDRSSLMFGETSSDGFKFCCLRLSFLQVLFWNLNFQVEFNQKSWGIAYSGQITEKVEKMMSAITLIWSSTGNILGSTWFFGVTRLFQKLESCKTWNYLSYYRLLCFVSGDLANAVFPFSDWGFALTWWLPKISSMCLMIFIWLRSTADEPSMSG